LPACSCCLVIPRAIMKRPVPSRDGSSDWLLERETIPRYGVRRESFVGGTSCHVRHVLHSSTLGAGAAAQNRKDHYKQSCAEKQMVHGSTPFSVIRSAPLSCRSRIARCASNPASRWRSTNANLSFVTPSAKSSSFFPGYNCARRNSAATVANPERSTVSSKQIGMKARLELSGLPPTLSGQSRTVV